MIYILSSTLGSPVGVPLLSCRRTRPRASVLAATQKEQQMCSLAKSLYCRTSMIMTLFHTSSWKRAKSSEQLAVEMGAVRWARLHRQGGNEHSNYLF